MSVRHEDSRGIDERFLTRRLQQVLQVGVDTGPSSDKRPRESDDPKEDNSDDGRKRKSRTAMFGYIDKGHNYSVTEYGVRDYNLPTRAGLLKLMRAGRWIDVCDWSHGRLMIQKYVQQRMDPVIYVLDSDGNLIAAALVDFPSVYRFQKSAATVIEAIENDTDVRSLFAILNQEKLLFEFEVVCTAGSTRGKLTQSENCLSGVSSWMIYGVVNLVYNAYVKPMLVTSTGTYSTEQLLRICMLNLDALPTARLGWETLGFQHLVLPPAMDRISGLYKMFRVMFPNQMLPLQPRDLRDCPEAPTEPLPSVEY
jgi:hypothetical protein